MAAFDAGDDHAHGHAHERARDAVAFGAGDDHAHGHAHERARGAACACDDGAAAPETYGHDERGFEARDTFAGARAGFCFTTGRLGTGYYRDRDPARPHACGCGKAFTTAQNLRRHRESPKCPLRPSDPGVSKS